MSEQNRVEELRQSALAKVQEEDFEGAIGLYEQALSLECNDETRELLTINKADAMIAIGRPGPEVQALPRILMARRNPHHTFIAAYALMFKHRLASEMKRAIFYGQLALDIAVSESQAFWKIAAFNDLGIIYQIDSQFEKSVESFQSALESIDSLDDAGSLTFSKTAILANLGYSRILIGEVAGGIEMLEDSLPAIQAQADLCDAHLELCYGFGELGQHEKARSHGERGLHLATNERQVRNAHYLLGEAIYKLGDIEAAESHFDELARFYPEFRNLKSLLFAVDLRSMINLKL